jgi:hypothetical protein
MEKSKVAVITPYFSEPYSQLSQCYESVKAQKITVNHFMIADGNPQSYVDTWNTCHIKLHRSHSDGGSFARGIGGLAAKAEGYDFIAYLDADNWYHSEHLSSLLSLWEATHSPVCSGLRSFHDVEGKTMNIFEPDEDTLRHIDTSCFLLYRSAFDCLPIWLNMPKILSPISDRVFLAGILHHKLKITSTKSRTVAYRTRYEGHYRSANMPIPIGAKGPAPSLQALKYLQTREGVTNCIATLGFWPLSYIDV